MDPKVVERLAAELGASVQAVESTAALLEERVPVPFIVRYRRERAGELSEDQVRALARRLREARSLEQRKAVILKQVEGQGNLTADFRERIVACCDRSELDDLYLPFRSKRRTRGTLAKERGLEPLARMVADGAAAAASLDELAAPHAAPERGLPDAAAVLEGVGHILSEWIAESPETRHALRQLSVETGTVRARVVQGKESQRSKYEMYYDFSEPVEEIPSHRILAIRRGEKEGWLEVRVEVDRDRALGLLRAANERALQAPTAPLVEAALVDAYDRLLAPALEADIRASLKRRADAEAIGVFTSNLRNLLLQPPAGPHRTLGVDPGYRTGCKLAVVDEQGQLLEHQIIFPHAPQSDAAGAKAVAAGLIDKHAVEAIAIGNGTASRETDHFFRELAKDLPGRQLVRMVVNEAAAGVYASSRAAREEFPDLDPSIRSAVSIGRRFQDPLYELVQVDPKSIGVGQYQHDVNQQALREGLEAAVESVVNLVGVDLNRASAALLSYVAGFDRAVAREIVRHRKEHGPFRALADLRSVPRIDERRFQHAAGFLWIGQGDEPLDGTWVHPEHYGLVARIAADAGADVRGLLGNEKLVRSIDLSRYAAEGLSEATLSDLAAELACPGRDPRHAFRCVEFRDDVSTVEQLQPGMILEGTVTNVTNFGAFVDIGVQEDGLVHVSQLSRRYVRDPNEAVHVGDIVRVKVLSVDAERRRIGLSIKEAAPPPKRKPRPAPKKDSGKGKAQAPKPPAKEAKPAPNRKATAEDIARLIAHFQSR